MLFHVGLFAGEGDLKTKGPDGKDQSVHAGVMHTYSDAPFDFNPSGDAKKFKLVDGSEVNVEAGSFYRTGFNFDLPAIVIAALVTVVLVIGIKEMPRSMPSWSPSRYWWSLA